MSNKFLTASSGISNLSNGTVVINAASITSSKFLPSLPVKTSINSELVSTKLDISDINSLQANLDRIITNPYNGDFFCNNLSTNGSTGVVRSSNVICGGTDLNYFANVTSSNISSNTSNISSLQTKTQNQSAVSGATSLLGNLTLLDNNNYSGVFSTNGQVNCMILNASSKVLCDSVVANNTISAVNSISTQGVLNANSAVISSSVTALSATLSGNLKCAICTVNTLNSGSIINTSSISTGSLGCSGNITCTNLGCSVLNTSSVVCSGPISGTTIYGTSGNFILPIVCPSISVSGNITSASLNTGAVVGTSVVTGPVACTNITSSGIVASNSLNVTNAINASSIIVPTITSNAITCGNISVSAAVVAQTITTSGPCNLQSVITGTVNCTSIGSSGNINTTNLTALSAVNSATSTISGLLTAGSASITNALTVGSITSPSLSVTNCTVSGVLNTGNIVSTGSISSLSSSVTNTAAVGNLVCNNLNSTNNVVHTLPSGANFSIVDTSSTPLVRFNVNNTSVLSGLLHTFASNVEPVLNLTSNLGNTLKRFSNGYFTNLFSETITAGINGLSIQAKAYIGTRPICSGGFSMTTESTLSNSTVEGNLITTGLGTLNILANSLSVGACSLSILTGLIVTSAPRTLILRLYLGTSLVDTITVSTTNLQAMNAPFELDIKLRIISTGTSGGIYAISKFTSSFNNYISHNRGTTINTTVDNLFRITGQWNIADSNTFLVGTTFNSLNIYQP